jgi:hypothetical protein
MTKSQAIRMFGSVAALASALRITRQAIYQWPEEVKEPRASQIKLIAMQRCIWPDGLKSGQVSFRDACPEENQAA